MLRSAAQNLLDAEDIFAGQRMPIPFWTNPAAHSGVWQGRQIGLCELGYWVR